MSVSSRWLLLLVFTHSSIRASGAQSMSNEFIPKIYHTEMGLGGIREVVGEWRRDVAVMERSCCNADEVVKDPSDTR